MKNNQPGITKRLVAAMLVAAAVVGVSALTMHAPTQNQNSLARHLKSIQTDKTTLFYADNRQDRCYFVEQVLPGTSESKAATENLKLIAAAL
jgi:site-specific recombinase